MNAPLSVELSDDFVRAVIGRAQQLGLVAQPEPEPDWLTVQEAADYLKISVGQIHNNVSAGRLPKRYARGHRAVFLRSDLDAFRAKGRA